MTTETMTAVEIQQVGLAALVRALGPVGMIRFLQQYESGAGDYTAERRRLLDEPDVATLVEHIREAAEGRDAG